MIYPGIVLENIRKSFFTNIGTKIGVLIFAIIIWFYTILGNTYSYIFDVPLNIINIEEGKIIKTRIPDKIQSEFTGKGISLLYLLFAPKYSFKFVIDLQSIRWFYDFPIKEYFDNNPEKIITPRNVDVKFDQIIWPDTIHIELDKVAKKKIPVVPNIEIVEEPGFAKIDNPIIFPDSITISGPRSSIKQISQIMTEKFTKNNVTTPVNVDIFLNVKDLKNISLSHNQINYFQEIELIGEKIIENIPVRILNVPLDKKITVSPSVISLSITAGVEVLKNLGLYDFDVTFDYAKSWENGKSKYIPDIKSPQNIISIGNITPRQIEIRVLKERN